ncbi:hypothetical protein ACKWTF_015421 [Chironomus riparius]
MLFVFWNDYVIPDIAMSNLRGREKVRKMNRLFELLPCIIDEKIEVMSSNEAIINSNTVIKSNVPRLCLIHIYNELKNKQGTLADAQNIFVDPQKLQSKEIFNDLSTLMDKNKEINLIIDCSKEVPINPLKMLLAIKSSFICVFSHKSQTDEQLQSIKNIKFELEMIYKVTDLTEESQKKLLKTEINFQSNFKVSVNDLLKGNPKIPKNKPQDDKILKDFCGIIDDRTLNLLIENVNIKTKIE